MILNSKANIDFHDEADAGIIFACTENYLSGKVPCLTSSLLVLLGSLRKSLGKVHWKTSRKTLQLRTASTFDSIEKLRAKSNYPLHIGSLKLSLLSLK